MPDHLMLVGAGKASHLHRRRNLLCPQQQVFQQPLNYHQPDLSRTANAQFLPVDGARLYGTHQILHFLQHQGNKP
jgi:hypothetical protein